MMQSSKSERVANAIDPMTLEVLRGQLDSAAQEMQLTIQKSSHSTIVTESLDATSVVFDRDGRTVARAVAIPIHLGVLAELGRRFATAFPDGVAESGDIYAINDLYAGGTHLSDIGVAAPVFHADELVGYVVTMTHQDVGGSVPGSTAGTVLDHFAEGHRIPMLRLVRAGERNEDVLSLTMANSRTPDNMRGDLSAHMAACNTGVRRLSEIYARWGTDTVSQGMTALLDYAERLTRIEIEKIPDGDPRGLQCGQNGPLCSTRIVRTGKQPEALQSKGVLQLNPGDRLRLWTNGSRGRGSALERESERVLEDVRDGRVSLEAAKDSYGIVI